MSDKEKALDALQVIINLATCHTLGKTTDEIIKQSETVQRALNQLTDTAIEGVRVCCFHVGMPGHTVPILEAQGQYSSCSAICGMCGRCL